mmetsp:Transcript_20107/g.14833  ORF Transcript_20107/g.14833 Transcript_20107/m.14833 type:complete len:100 (+) Transcript_20107:49-348(+)
MIIDAQAIEHLELLEVGGKRGEGSFFYYISQGCSTASGKRMLKRWVVSPLFNKKRIEERLEAVESLLKHSLFLDKTMGKLRGLPDIERMLSRIYTYSAK